MSNVDGGTYTVDVTDNTGCVASDAVVINEPTELVLSTSSTQAGCGQSDGAASVSVTGGATPYGYLWDDPSAQTTTTAIGLASGGYTVVVTDGTGCTASASATVTNANGPVVTLLPKM